MAIVARLLHGESSKRLPLAIMASALLALGLMWGALIYEGQQDKTVALAQARRDTANLAIAFREHIRRTLTAIDQVMLVVKAEYASDPDGYRLPDWLDNSPFLSGIVVQIGIIGTDGFARQNTLPRAPEPIDLSDRAHFRHHLDAGAAQPFISQPVIGRGSGHWSIQVSRRLERRDGSFAGVLVVSLDPFYLTQLFDTVDLGKQGALILVGRDGIVRARRAMASDQIGQDLSASRMVTDSARHDQGTYVAHSSTDRIDRIYSYAVVPDYPLIVAAGMGVAEVLVQPEAEQFDHFAIGAGLSIVVLALTLLLLREVDQGRRRQRDIAEQAALVAAILDVSPAAIWMRDNEDRFVMLNGAAAEVVGQPQEAIVGHRTNDVLPADVVARTRVWDAEARAAVGGTVLGEHSMSGKDGLRHLLTFRRACDLGGRSLVVGSAMDVTPLRRVEAELRSEMKQREQAEAGLRQAQKMEAIGKLTGGVAHDFNNLLTSILGNIELAQRRLRDGQARRLLHNAERAGRRGAELIQHLLAFARKQHLDTQAVDLNRLVIDMGELLEHMIGPATRIETALLGDLWPAMADANQVEVAVLNIAINARDAMPTGGTLSIRTANVAAVDADLPPELAAGDYVKIAIADSGTGMSQEVLAKAFDPFFTTKEVGKGSGLGLSQVYGMALQSGGTAVVDSRLGAGTTVSLYLPRAHGQVLDKRPPLAGRARSRAGGAAIIVVDDDPQIGDFVATCLGEHGHHVVAAADGRTALAAIAETRFDLMVVDVLMPEMLGVEVVRLARLGRPELPVLYITGHDGDAATGGDPVLTKPFTASRLIAEVDNVLAHRRTTCATEPPHL